MFQLSAEVTPMLIPSIVVIIAKINNGELTCSVCDFDLKTSLLVLMRCQRRFNCENKWLPCF